MRAVLAAIGIAFTLWLAAISPSAVALLLAACTLVAVGPLLLFRRAPSQNLWDQSMLKTQPPTRWFANLWVWWGVVAAILVGIYLKFW